MARDCAVTSQVSLPAFRHASHGDLSARQGQWLPVSQEHQKSEEPVDPQIAALRRMTPQARLRTASLLWHSARKLKRAALRQQHANLSEAQIHRLLNEAFLYARD